MLHFSPPFVEDEHEHEHEHEDEDEVEDEVEGWARLGCLLLIHIPVINNFGDHPVTDFEGSVETRDIG